MSHAQATEILSRVREGASIRSLIDPAESPFSGWQFRKYCKAHPAYRVEVLAASKTNEIAKKSANAQRRFGDKTHCPKGHEYAGENVGMKMSRGRPSRFCKVCSRLAAAAVRPMTPEQIERVKTLVAQNVPQNKMVKGGPLYVTGHQNIAHQRSIDPEFDRLMAEANAHHLAMATGPDKQKMMARRRAIIRQRRQAEDYRRVSAMMPNHLPATTRDDIIQEIMCALLERRISRDALRDHVRRFVTDHHRMFPVNFAKFGDARLVSLDEVMFDDSARTRGETVSRGLWG